MAMQDSATPYRRAPSSRAMSPVIQSRCYRRQKSQRRQRIAQRDAFEPGDHGNERRLIDVAPVQVVATGEVIQFVDKIPVTAAHEDVKKKEYEGEPADERPISATGLAPRSRRLDRGHNWLSVHEDLGWVNRRDRSNSPASKACST